MSLFNRPLLALLAATTLAGCGAVDKVLEGNVAPDARLSVEMPSSAISVARGASQQFTVNVTRVGDYNGPVEVIVDNGPAGVTATLGAQTTTGQTTSVPVTVSVDAAVAVGAYTMRVLGRAPRIPDAARVLNLNVLPQPAFEISASRQAITVVKGGIAPLTVSITRTNFTAPVTLSLTAPAGLSATFAESPLTGTASAATIVAAADMNAGTYDATIRGAAEGMTTRETGVTISVISDPLQLIVNAATTRQGSTVTTAVVINRNGFADAVTLAASGLPAGVTATFDPTTTTGNNATMTLTVAPSVAAQGYTGTLTASANGAPIATGEFSLTVTPSSLSLALSPPAVSVFQGANTTTKLTLTRTSLEAPVAISFGGLPAGVTASASPASVTGNESTITIAASNAAFPGDYSIAVIATPPGWPTAGAPNATLALTVRPVPGTEGNVILDWSRCTAPLWVAKQDGTGAWTQVMATSGGVYRFSALESRGGFAYADGDGVTIRYLTLAQLTAAPHDLCPPVVTTGSKTVTGSGAHVGANESYTYNLGGVSTTSTTVAPNFQLLGVPEGTHDLVVWGSPTITGARGLIRRDQNLPDGESLGLIDLVGTEAFAPLRPNVTQSGAFQANDVLSHSMSYLTTPACTENRLYTTGATGTVTVMLGVPDNLQRPTDFHMISVTVTGTSRSRMATVVFNRMQARTVAIPPLNGAPTITSLNGSYRRLQLVASGISSVYNGSMTFRYTTGLKSMTIRASAQYVASAVVSLLMPDFSTVSGWQDAYAVPAGAGGSWTFTTDGGALSAPLCTEGRTTILSRQFGTF